MNIDPETLGSFQLITIFLVVSVFNFACGQAMHSLTTMFRLGKKTWQRALTVFLASIISVTGIGWIIVSLGLKVV